MGELQVNLPSFVLVMTSEILLFVLAIASGLVIRTTLVLSGQQWARSFSNTVTYLILPVVGLVIVQVISNSIALSLGMIGALSIVRFRHPVKSPLELTVFFLLLTVGVTLSQRRELAILLVAASALVIFTVSRYQHFKLKRGTVAFPISAADGDASFILEVAAKRPLTLLEASEFLVFSHANLELPRYDYKLAFTSREELSTISTALSEEDSVLEIAGTYS